MFDETESLYDHIRNRLADGFGFGDDGAVEIDGEYDHRTSYQSIRERNEGDVGIFEYLTNSSDSYNIINKSTLWCSNIQISVVTKNGDIRKAKEFLIETFKNLVKNDISTYIYMRNVVLLNIEPIGKNKEGLQMVVMSIKCFYYKYVEEV